MQVLPPFPQQKIDDKRRARMAKVDALPPDIRELVHQYGLTTVQACMDHGVRRAASIRHIVETVLNEFSPTRGSYSKQGLRTEVDR